VGDFNGDGKPNLAVAADMIDDADRRGGVGVLLGKGDGSFRPSSYFAAGPHPIALVASDFDGDGRRDPAVADNIHAGRLSLLLGRGDGTFQGP
jgi:hypothetical protein